MGKRNCERECIATMPSKFNTWRINVYSIILKMLPVPVSYNDPKALGQYDQLQIVFFINFIYRNVFCLHLACLCVITYSHLRISVH